MGLNAVTKRFNINLRTKQVASLFSVNLITIPIGIIVSIFLTRFLGSEDYGNYQFIFSIFGFSITLLTFGFLHAGNRAIVLNHNITRTKQYYGTLLLVLVVIFILMSILLLIFGLFDTNLETKNIKSIFILSIPIGFVFLLMSYFETLLQADNKIKLLGQSRLITKVLFGVVVVILYLFFQDIALEKLKLTLFLFFITQILTYAFIISKLKVSFKSYRQRLNEIMLYNKNFGFNVYLGSLFALGFSSLSQILIGYFGIDNSGVGYFSLAVAFSLPLSLIPNTIATTHYKDFSRSSSISKKIILITVCLSILALVAVWILVPPFVNYFYGEEFRPVIKINFIVSIGVVLYGFGDFFNRFLGANGQGKSLRNSAFYVGGSLMLSSVLLIPRYGAYGAAFSKLLAGFIYLVTIIIYYIKFKRSKQK